MADGGAKPRTGAFAPYKPVERLFINCHRLQCQDAPDEQSGVTATVQTFCNLDEQSRKCRNEDRGDDKDNKRNFKKHRKRNPNQNPQANCQSKKVAQLFSWTQNARQTKDKTDDRPRHRSPERKTEETFQTERKFVRNDPR